MVCIFPADDSYFPSKEDIKNQISEKIFPTGFISSPFSVSFPSHP